LKIFPVCRSKKVGNHWPIAHVEGTAITSAEKLSSVSSSSELEDSEFDGM